MNNDNNAITFVVSGHAEFDASGSVREVRVQGAQRDGSVATHRLVAVGGVHAVQISVQCSNGKTLQLVLHPEHARDLLQSQQTADVPSSINRDGGAAQNSVLSGGEVAVPVRASWRLPASMTQQDGSGGQRSMLGDLVFGALKLIGLDVYGAAVGATAEQVMKWRDGQVTEGVYRLTRDRLSSLKDATSTKLDSTDQAQLVLIHGTAVDTTSTFGKWWDEHPGAIRRVFDSYKDQVYALDHATLGKSPIHNALTLAKALQPNARLHLVTHSRGGLVAEVLVRACAGISETDLDFFADTGGRDYSKYRSALTALRNELKDKNIRIERVVRVACPAHGTYLASGRLDAYFSVLAFLLEGVIGSLGDDIAKFLEAVASRRMDPSELPGLESMMPGRPMALWINSPRTPVMGDLRVVAGDVEPSLLDAWIRTLVASAAHPLFMGDNDLVVNTSAMYGGAVRTGSALFLLDRSPQTDHFHYFSNDSTANGVEHALLLESPPNFAPIGPLSASGKDSGGLRGVRAPRVVLADDGKRPAVVVLPGILGSNLIRSGQREWFELHRVPGLIDRIQWGTPGIEQNGPVEDYYDDLIDYLEQTHHVQPQGYDWRVPLEDSAGLLAQTLTTLLKQREDSQQPVRILAHSMGGMVVRVMKLRHPDIWQKMMTHTDARFVMLGVPNAGSWAPMSIYTGDDRFGQMLAILNGPFSDFKTRQKMVQFEGLLQLAAGLQDPEYKLDDLQSWKKLAKQDQAASHIGPWHVHIESVDSFYRWALPDQDALTRASSLRSALDDQAKTVDADAEKMALVLGESKATPFGLTVTPQKGVEYRYTAEGDGRVTWASACLPRVRSWKVGFVHAELPKARKHFAAYLQLLQGVPNPDLPLYIPTTMRGAASPNLLSWQGRSRDIGSPIAVDSASLLDAAMGGGTFEGSSVATGPSIGTPLQVDVIHGDLKFVREPLLLGHSSALKLTGSEAAVDRILGNTLDDALRAGLYPERVGEHKVFINTQENADNPWGMKRPPVIVVVGLGNEGDLKRGQLQTTVRQGVLAFAQHMAQAAGSANQPNPKQLRLAMTSIGSGGAMSVGESVSAVVQGVLDANTIIASSQQRAPWPQVTALVVIEQYLNRATEAWHTLSGAQQSQALDIAVSESVRAGQGGMRNPTGLRYRGASYDFVRVTQATTDHDSTGNRTATANVLEYSLVTSRARSELRSQQTQHSLVDQLIEIAEGNPRYDAEIACSLHRLLIPPELRAYLSNAGSLVLELDLDTARYPWEMLADRDTTGKIWSLGLPTAGAMVRRLRLHDFRANPVDSLSNKVLVIGVSKLESFRGYKLPPLPGVITEVEAVVEALNSTSSGPNGGLSVKPVLDQCLDACVKPLLAGSWKVVHLSGHGVRMDDGLTGMLISDNAVIGPAEIKAMHPVPALVFVNCCHLGKIDGVHTQGSHGRFAASVAEQLISNGVRCVVAAGWAVDDAAAMAFAKKFYTTLGEGKTFGDAVKDAREEARKKSPPSNTWAAYQCYGDLDWRLISTIDTGQTPNEASNALQPASVDELLLRLERITVEANDAEATKRNALKDELKRIGAQHNAPYLQWMASGRVAQAIAEAWKGVDDQEQAIHWYAIAINAKDGSASLKAREQQLNLQARLPNASLKDIYDVVVALNALIDLAPTAERWNILGSAYKRAVMRAKIELPGNSQFAIARLTQMRTAYEAASGLDTGGAFYPVAQSLLARICLHQLDQGNAKPALNEIAALRNLVHLSEQRNGPDFWTTVAMPEIDMIEALLQDNLAQRLPAIKAGFASVRQRVSSPHLWKSVADTARFYQTAGRANQATAIADLLQSLLGFANEV